MSPGDTEAPPEGNPLEVEPGPPFAPSEHDRTPPEGEAGEETVAAPIETDGPLVEVSEDQIRELLTAGGTLCHAAAVDKQSTEWLWLEPELDAIVPPLTRIVNRYDPLRRAAAHGDYLTIAMAAGGYGQRSLSERAAAKAEVAVDEAPGPDTGQVDFEYVGPVPTQPPA